VTAATTAARSENACGRFLEDGVAQLPDPVDLDADHVADPEQALGERWRTAPIPAGVPVAITSPGSSVKASDSTSLDPHDAGYRSDGWRW
jgi:hypothetical protein